MRELRIHHFFDMIRDYGSEKELKPHPFGHSYHLIGKEVFENKVRKIKLVIKNDDVCETCNKLSSGKCTDSIDHRADFVKKQLFNDFLDNRIMKAMGYHAEQVVEIKELFENAYKYLDSLFEIYKGNDLEHTKMRQFHVRAGLDKKNKELGVRN